MESNKKNLRDREDLRKGKDQDASAEGMDLSKSQMEESSQPEEHHDEHKKHKHHEDHSINRKYRPFRNHSSNDDMPHTNTSF